MSKSIKNFFQTPAVNIANKKARVEVRASSTVVSDDASETNTEETAITLTSSESTEWLSWDLMEPTWKSKLSGEFSQSYAVDLQRFLNNEAKSHTIYPPKSQLFSAFNLCPFDNVKVCVVWFTIMCQIDVELISAATFL